MSIKNNKRQIGQIATQPEVMNTSSFNLLGVYGSEQNLRALVRLSGGRIKEVAPGVKVPGGIVAAIDKDGLLILQGGETRRLRMPGD